MPQLNFNALASSGPQGFYQGFEQNQKEKVTSEMNQIKLDELKRDRDEMIQLKEKLVSLGQDPDPGKFLDALAQTGKPEYVKMAIEGKQKIKDLDAYAKLGVIEPVNAPPAMPTGTPSAMPIGAPALRMPQAAPPTNALGSGMFGMAPAPVNAMAPQPNAMASAPVNAMAPQPNADLIAPTQQRIRQLLDFARSNPRMASQAMSEARILQDQLELYSRRGQAESPDAVIMQRLGYPLTPEGFRAYNEAKRAPVAPAKTIGNVSPSDFTPASLAKFNASGNYGDLILKPVDRAPRPEPAVRTQQVKMDDGTIGIMNMDTGAVTPATLGGAPVKSQDASKTAVSEQQAAYNIGRLLTAANQIKDITGKDPSSMKPGATEAFASSVGMGGTANLARPANRQIVQGAQRDALDALLYLATGAAYNKEQLLGQMEAYIPAFTDAAETVAAKQMRMADLIQSAKARAGKAWTPQMDAAMKTLMSPSKVSGKVTPAAAAAPPGVDAAIWNVMTPEERKLWQK